MKKKRCLWCPEVEGCSSCSMSGDNPRNYQLVPLSMVDEQLDLVRRKERRKWLGVLLILGIFTAGVVAFLVALLEATG